MTPRRIQRKRTCGWRKPAGVVNVTRPGKWGNPFSIAEFGFDKALEFYRRWLDLEVTAGHLDLEELHGKDLMCWCKPGAPCHGDILLKKANGRQIS